MEVQKIMSKLEKKLEEELEKIEKTIEKDIKKIEDKVHQHNLFPIAAGGLSVFFLMVTMVVAAPYMFLLNVPATERAHEYTPMEAQGRELYMNLGCFYCHSQQVRLYDWGIGTPSEKGDFVYNSPQSLGTERTGPDLAQIGGMRPSVWHQLHHRDPRSVSPGSIMPNFGFLTNEEIEALAIYLQNQGGEDLQVDDSVTGGKAYHPDVPQEYQNVSNLFGPLMMQVRIDYNPENDTYNGNTDLGDEWATIFDLGKEIFTQRCLSCHGCSGNAQGPYARHLVTQPANLNARISTFPGDYYHIWRVSEGVSGTAMPTWKLSLNETEISLVAIYEMSFVFGSTRTVSGDISDSEGDVFAETVLNAPPIDGTIEEFEKGNMLFDLYCAQCHGEGGQADGPASINSPGGFVTPEPANFTESGSDFPNYGRYVWKVKEGVETTNMPPWKWVLTDNEVYQIIFYIQTFSTPSDYNLKWAPQYSDSFAQNLMKDSSLIKTTSNSIFTADSVQTLLSQMGILLWELRHRKIVTLFEKLKIKTAKRFDAYRRYPHWN
jgi:cytochrome c oxidase cbb3-type subunit I/II